MADETDAAVSVPGDGVVDVGHPPKEITMAFGVASEQFNTLCEQNFFELSKGMTHDSMRLRTMRDNVAEQSSLGYLTEQRVVGVREAKASTLLQPVYGQPVPIQPGNPGAGV